uniref:Uncharacterized protein n=1 Tax=Steinernema glaseri TaxID=37863 RepID=A0A1I7YTF2_9BILA
MSRKLQSTTPVKLSALIVSRRLNSWDRTLYCQIAGCTTVLMQSNPKNALDVMATPDELLLMISSLDGDASARGSPVTEKRFEWSEEQIVSKGLKKRVRHNFVGEWTPRKPGTYQLPQSYVIAFSEAPVNHASQIPPVSTKQQACGTLQGALRLLQVPPALQGRPNPLPPSAQRRANRHPAPRLRRLLHRTDRERRWSLPPPGRPLQLSAVVSPEEQTRLLRPPMRRYPPPLLPCPQPSSSLREALSTVALSLRRPHGRQQGNSSARRHRVPTVRPQRRRMAALPGPTWISHGLYLLGRFDEKGLVSQLEVFKTGLGHCMNFKAYITMKPDARPITFQPRPVAFACKDKMKTAIDRLAAVEVTSKLSSTRFVSPCVAASKKNGELRVCGDFKVTINLQMEVDQHLISIIKS